jgi:hypothetical protein
MPILNPLSAIAITTRMTTATALSRRGLEDQWWRCCACGRKSIIQQDRLQLLSPSWTEDSRRAQLSTRVIGDSTKGELTATELVVTEELRQALPLTGHMDGYPTDQAVRTILINVRACYPSCLMVEPVLMTTDSRFL